MKSKEDLELAFKSLNLASSHKKPPPFNPSATQTNKKTEYKVLDPVFKYSSEKKIVPYRKSVGEVLS